MDQVKIGKFIAECRKRKNLTQSQLAEKLNMSDKSISKWETGKGMPDSSIMLELCSQLDINVNELLSGERLEDSKYQEKANQNIIKMAKESERNKRIKNKFICITCIILFILVMLIIAFGIYDNAEVSIAYDDRIMKCEFVDNEVICSINGLSLVHFEYEKVHMDEETLIFVTGKMLLQNKIHSHFESWDSMAQLIANKNFRFASGEEIDITDCKEKVKVYYTEISFKKIRKANETELQEIIEQSHLMIEK